VLLSYNSNTYRDLTGNLKDDVIEGSELDTNNLINTVDNINSTIYDYIDNNKNKDEKIPKISASIIEPEEKLTMLISKLFPVENKEQALFLVIMGKKLENLHYKHGLNRHGNSKGILTEIQIGTESFLPFSASENGLPQGWDKINGIIGNKRNKSENSSSNLSATDKYKMTQIRDENVELIAEKKQLLENAAQNLIDMSVKDEIHSLQLEEVVQSIKDSKNEMRKMKISATKKGSKYIQDVGHKDDEGPVLNDRGLHRAIKIATDVINIEAKGNFKK
jgi:hypothetical protein